MFVGGVERRDEYATIITIALMVLFRNLAIVLGGPNQYAPPDYARPITLGNIPISGNRFVALIGTLVLLALFYLVIRRRGSAAPLRGRRPEPRRDQTAGIDVLRLDMLAFGVASRWRPRPARSWPPTSLVYPENGAISTFKGFEINRHRRARLGPRSIVGGGAPRRHRGARLGLRLGGPTRSLRLPATDRAIVFRPTGLFGSASGACRP